MTRPRGFDVTLLALVSACLLFGGGLGCDPVLQGVDFRATSVLSDPNDRTSPRDWFMAFNGRKAPGNGSAQLPYALTAPFGVSARMGVFREDALAASVDADGCIGLRDTASSDEYRLCVTYEVPENVHISSNLDGTTADCAGVSRAALDLDDDGVNVMARYRCGSSGPFSTLATTASLWSDAEEWNAFVSAAGVAKGGQVAFDDFHVTTDEIGIGDPREVAFITFEAWRLGVESFYAIEDGDFTEAGALAGEAQGKLQYVADNAADPDAQKLLSKIESSFAKLLLSSAKYQKGFVKVADQEADALEALGSGP